MKKVFALIAIAAASLLLASCNGKKNADEEATEGQEMVEEGQDQLAAAQEEIATQLVGVWTATMPVADSGKKATYTLTFKDGNKFDLVEAQAETAASKLLNVTDADYTLDANKVVLGENGQLEFADGKLYVLNEDGTRATQDEVDYVYTKVVE